MDGCVNISKTFSAVESGEKSNSEGFKNNCFASGEFTMWDTCGEFVTKASTLL